jgi:hypothetical protein
MRIARRIGCVLWVLLALPVVAFAQASITGVVRDTSGGVLPGVTVEAASPALIEQARTVVTDGTGQYRIIDLRPGTYAVTFTLAGFNAVKREGIVLTGSLTATVNADLRVGGLEETITVSGQTPVVDVQSVTQQRVLDKVVVDALPSGRTATNVAVLIPGINLSTTFSGEGQDVGGTTGDVMQSLSIHGSRGGDYRQMLDGMNMGSETAGGSTGGYSPNMGAVQEVTVDTSAVSAEQVNGGVRVNLIPREGGNTFRGSFFATGGTEKWQSDNVTPELLARNLITPNRLKRNYDINPAYGGPIARNKVWFFSAGRVYDIQNYIAGVVKNANAGNASAWTYSPDRSFRGSRDTLWTSVNTRVTWQATQKNKLAFFIDSQTRCSCYDTRQLVAPESTADYRQPRMNVISGTYTAPLTNRLLLEAAYLQKPDDWGYFTHEGQEAVDDSIGVLEQSTQLSYHGPIGYFGQRTSGQIRFRADLMDRHARGAVSYVTGAHAFKAGFTQHWGQRRSNNNIAKNNITYQFNFGVPNQVSLRLPFSSETHVSDGGVYAQDRWTIDRLTLNLAVRWDYFHSGFPEQTLGPALYAPTRGLTFPEQDWASFNDITPKVGVAYDVFGTGKTAVKASLSKFVEALSYNGNFGDTGSPTQRVASQTFRTWVDANQNFNPDCDLANAAAHGECSQFLNANFGRVQPATNFDPDILSGWGKRGFSWEGSASVQHEVWRNVSAEVGYFRRWYGNFLATDNLALSPSDYTAFQVTAPADSRLPENGGNVVRSVFDVNRIIPADNRLTFASNYGDWIENWQGFDVSVNARLPQAALLQGGISTGRTLTDNCEVREKLPELTVTNGISPLYPYCHVETPYLTQFKLLGAYTIPRIDVQAAVTVQSIPGPQLAANVNLPSAAVTPSLGRPLTAGPTSNATINVIEPGTLYGDRLNQVDLRLGKVFRFGDRRAAVNFDLFNVANANAVLTENMTFGPVWRQPLSILGARLAKVSVNVDF